MGNLNFQLYDVICIFLIKARNKKKREEEKMRKLKREAAKNNPEEEAESNFRKKCTICLDVYTIEVS